MPARQRRFTAIEYIELENDAHQRHEYHDGEILAMAGGSPEQSFITANFVREAGNALKGKPCRVAESNLRVRIPHKSRYVYPDASIICGPLQFDPQDPKRHSILNPKVIIEVLSPSTEAYDRGDKFTQYREIPAFEEYILISQDRPNFESFLRQAGRRLVDPQFHRTRRRRKDPQLGNFDPNGGTLRRNRMAFFRHRGRRGSMPAR